MSKQKTHVTTTNKTIDPNSPLEIDVEIELTVPDTIAEAAEFFEGEEKLVEVIQQEVVRRKSNAARPLLRDSEVVLDWQSVAQQAAEAYQPGRKGGFQQPVVSATELEKAVTGGSVEDMLAYLKSQGVRIGE